MKSRTKQHRQEPTLLLNQFVYMMSSIVKSNGGDILKIRGLGEPSLAHHNGRGEDYHEPKHMYIMRGKRGRGSYTNSLRVRWM